MIPPETTNSEISSEISALSDKDKQKLISWANEQYQQMKTARWRQERQWYLNLAFFFGQQNVAFKGGDNISRDFKLYVPPAPYYRSRPIINQIRPRIRKEMSKLTAQKPSAFVVPSSSEERDMFAAHAGEQIWDSLYRFKKIHNVLRRAVFWTSTTGNGFIKSWWDEDTVDELSNQLGDIRYAPVTPFHLFVPDLKEEDIEFQPFIMEASMRNVEQLSQQFGKDLQLESSAKAGIMEESFLNVLQVDKSQKEKEVMVLECWIKPGTTKILPAGGMYTIAGNEVIGEYINGWPYGHGRYPYAHVPHIPSGKFYRDSIINDLMPLQKEYNRTRGQIIEAKNRMAKPQLAAELGSIDPSKVTTEPGQIILYRPGFQAPVPIPLQELPSYVIQEVERIKQDMDEISGQHEVSRGQTPPGVTAATAISYLQEQDDSILSHTYDGIEEALEKVAFLTLNYVHQYWDTPRMVKVTGEDGSFDVMAFQGSQLNGNTDVRVEAGSALPTSKAAKQAFIMDLMKMGFIDPQKGLEVMEIGGINKIYEQVQVDVRQTQRENLKMAQATGELIEQFKQEQISTYMQSPAGQEAMANEMLMEGPEGDLLDITPTLQGMPPIPVANELIVPVNTWDDHRLHIERHNSYRKSQAFENLPEEAKSLFDAHVQGHVAAIMEGAQAAMPPEMLEAGMFDIGGSNSQETYKESEQMMMEQQAPQQEG